MRGISLALPLILSLGPTAVSAATLCVNPGGTGGCSSSIQAAIDAAAAGDTITIAVGTYVEQLTVLGKSELTLQGAGADLTVVDGGGASVVLDIGSRYQGEKLTLTDLTIQNGHYGIYSESLYNRVTIANCTIRQNTSGGVAADGQVTMTGCTVTGNTGAGGAVGVIVVRGKFTLTESTVSDNDQAMAVGNEHRSTRATVVASTFNGNATGVHVFRARLTLTNSTLSGNPGYSVDVNGGSGTLASTTISDGGVFVEPRSRLVIENSILPDCTGTIIARAFNLLENTSGCVIRGQAPNVITGMDPMLGPLADNGGPTQTRALSPASPAIDAGDPGPNDGRGTHCPPTDQRGVPRTGRCDLGAYES